MKGHKVSNRSWVTSIVWLKYVWDDGRVGEPSQNVSYRSTTEKPMLEYLLYSFTKSKSFFWIFAHQLPNKARQCLTDVFWKFNISVDNIVEYLFFGVSFKWW